MSAGRPDFTNASLINGEDSLGNLVTVAVDKSGNIIGILQGSYGGVPTTLATDASGRMLARLMGSYGGTMIDVSVDASGRLSMAGLDQTYVNPDPVEAQTWTSPIVNLLSNLNRIRYAIISATGEAWGTSTHTIAATWAQIATAIGVHAALPDVHHARSHAIDSASDHTGVITDTQHGVRTEANAHAHGDLSGVSSDQHHARSHNHSSALDGNDLTSIGHVSIGMAGTPFRFQIEAGGDQVLSIGGSQAISSSVTINAINEANSANIPFEIRASKTYISWGGLAVLAFGAGVLQSDGSGNITSGALPIDTYPHVALCLNAYTVGQGTWFLYNQGTLFGNAWLSNNAGANGDNIRYQVWLKAGSYAMLCSAAKGSSACILQILIDGVQVSNTDLYAASPADINISTTGITIAADGVHLLKFNVNGANGSSSGYTLQIWGIAIGRVS